METWVEKGPQSHPSLTGGEVEKLRIRCHWCVKCSKAVIVFNLIFHFI